MKVACPIVTYLVAGFLTFAWVYESFEDRNYYRADRELGSLIAGAAWPIYWAGKGALASMRWLKKNSAVKQCFDRQTNRSWAPDEDGVCIFQQPSQPK